MFSNTIFFSIGSLGSKVIIFFLVPFYTFYLSPQELGTGDLLISIGMVLIPVMTLSISDAVLRFQLEEDHSGLYSKALSNGVMIVILQGVVLTLGSIGANFFLSDIYLYIYTSIYIFSSSLFLVFQQYLKAINQNKLYAMLSILHAFLIGIFMVLSLKEFELGLKGFLISQSIPPLIISLFLILRLYKVIQFSIDKPYLKKMLNYSTPLMPNAIFWWIMQLSNRLLITLYLGVFATGIFTVASKIPSIINIFTSIFIQAWQISAVELKKQKDKYYGIVFDLLFSSLLLLVALLFLVTDPLVSKLFSADYQSAKTYIPPLYLASFFSALSAFIATNYLVEMNTKMVLKSTLFGGITNLFLSAITIPFIGLAGAAISMLISFFITFLIRYVHSDFNSLVSNRIFKCISLAPLLLIVLLEVVLKIELNSLRYILILITVITSLIELYLMSQKIWRLKNESFNGWS